MSRKVQQERFDQLFRQNEALQTMLAQQATEAQQRKDDLNRCLTILGEVYSQEIAVGNLLATTQQEPSGQLLGLQTTLEDVRSGDLSRRIELLQGKLIFIEEMLQKNAMDMDAQRSGAMYEFILRMQALFPVGQAKGAGQSQI